MDLIEDVRRESHGDGTPEARAERIAALIRERTGRRWVGIYRVTDTEVRNLAWSGPAPPAYSTFPAGRGLTGAAVASGGTVISNDVGKDSRYLTNQPTTGSELIAPVVMGGRVVGTLDVEDGAVQAFGDEDQMLFESLAAALPSLYTSHGRNCAPGLRPRADHLP